MIQKHWLKHKKKVLLIHGDIFFNEKYLDNIIRSKKNIIGCKILNKKSHTKDEVFKIKLNKNKSINKISKKLNKKETYYEVIGINKLSSNVQYRLFKFMNEEFKKKIILNYHGKK